MQRNNDETLNNLYFRSTFTYILRYSAKENPVIERSSLSFTSLSNLPETYNKYSGIEIVNSGPRGGVYNSRFKSYDYRLFRVQLRNDTASPFELNIKFPNKPTVLFPDTNQFVNVFLFPDDLTPDTVQDVYNFGIRNLESFLDSSLNKPIELMKLIKPNEVHIIYIGVITGELARAKLFIKGQDADSSFPAIKSDIVATNDKTTLNLVFGLAINPPQHYSLIHCGKINFKK